MEREMVHGGDPLALPMDVDEDGFPLVHKFKARIDDMEHRLDYLIRRWNPSQYGDGRARILGEIHALKAGLVVMRYHELEVGGETSVITALERLVRTLRGRGVRLPDDGDAALVHAEAVIKDLTRSRRR